MTYYRLAVQNRQSTYWVWKTTSVTSLQTVLQLLRSYRMLPQDRIRVFTASTKENLNEMLSRQNNHLASGSVTAAEFLQARKISSGEQAQSASWERVSAEPVQQTTDVVVWVAREMHAAAQATQQGADAATWTRELWEKQQAARRGVSDAPTSPLREHLTTASTLLSPGMSFEEKKRLEIELGPGGDHDKPYLFTLPISLKERLDWIRLQKQVQVGELSS